MFKVTFKPAEANQPERTGAATAKGRETGMVAAIRVVLASLGLFVIYLDPAQPDRYVQLTYLTLALYTFYSALICVAILRSSRSVELLHGWFHWIDVAWYTALVSLSSGTNSIFFIFFFFAIVVGSFRLGFRTGLALAAVSSTLFSCVGILFAPPEPAFELNRFLLRPLSLLVIGYALARWGGYRIELERELALLKDLTAISNPRFGVVRTIGLNIERIRTFFGARSCLYILSGSRGGPALLYSAREGGEEAGCQPEEIAASHPFLSLSLVADQAVACGRTERLLIGPSPDDPNETEQNTTRAKLQELLPGRFFVTVPVRSRLEDNGRLYLTRDKRPFEGSDVAFVSQIVDQMAPVLDNIQLVDRLASTAAEEERRRIARDIHDSVIQPYVGLQMGLVSVQQRMAEVSDSGCGQEQLRPLFEGLRARIARLVAMTDDGIANLRGFVGELNRGGDSPGTLTTAVRRFASKFSEATGISTTVEADDLPLLNDRLAAEVFQMAAEGLSNIRRHTQSPSAVIRMSCARDTLLLRIENQGPGDSPGASFTPRSITERARSLQGRAFVEETDNGGSAVVAEIPL